VKDTLDTLRLNVSDVRARAHRTANQGMSSAYVAVKLVPGAGGAVALAKVRTATRSRTLFPLYDETFDLIVPESTGRERTFLLFAVKDRGPLGDKILLGEAFLPLENIPVRYLTNEDEMGSLKMLSNVVVFICSFFGFDPRVQSEGNNAQYQFYIYRLFFIAENV